MKKIIKSIFIHNYIPKLVVLLLACSVWFLVRSEESVMSQYNTLVNVEVADNMFLTDVNPRKINVTLEGRKNIMKEYINKNIPINLDLRNKQKTQSIHLSITKDKVNCPPELFVKKIEPDYVDVQIDRGIKKSLTIEIKTHGNPSIGHTLKRISANPSVIEITGPETILKEKTSIFTKPISIAGMDNSFTQRIGVEPLYHGQTNLPDVDVYVDIVPSLKTRTLTEVKLQIVKSPMQAGNISIKPVEVDIEIEGSESYIHDLKESDIIVYVNISDLKEGKYELPIRTIIHRNYNIKSISPEVAEVTIGLLEIKGP
ncbi:MAG: hypothetical protein KAI43_00975 [Candidatus Aureabacteria bacterium]|nr:hypothetical protein [Candidatus Auribacterota bacterium]